MRKVISKDGTPIAFDQSGQGPTLVMDGTVFLGRAESHVFLHHGAQELANILPNAQRRTLEGQDHGPADEVLATALKEFFLG